jgi:hypothetical protein
VVHDLVHNSANTEEENQCTVRLSKMGMMETVRLETETDPKGIWRVDV